MNCNRFTIYPFLSYLEYENENNILENWAINHPDIIIKYKNWQLVDFCFEYREIDTLKALIKNFEEDKFLHYFNKKKDNTIIIEDFINYIIKYKCINLLKNINLDKIDKSKLLNNIIKYGVDIDFDFQDCLINPNYIIECIEKNNYKILYKFKHFIPSNNQFPEISDSACKTKDIELIRFLSDNDISFPSDDSILYISTEDNVIDILEYFKYLYENKNINFNWVKGFIGSCNTNKIDNIQWYIRNIIGKTINIDDLYSYGLIHSINNNNIYNILEDMMILSIKYLNNYQLFKARYKSSPNEEKYIFLKNYYDLKQENIFNFIFNYINKSKEDIDKIESFKQRTIEWEKARIGVISGTAAGPSVGHSPYHKSINDFLKELLTPSFKGNMFTIYGTYVEPLSERLTRLFVKINKMMKNKNIIGIDFWDDGFRICEENPWLGVSSDGHYYILHIDGPKERGTIELKAPARKNNFYDECPHQYYDQFQTASYVLKTDEIQFVCFTPSKIQFNFYKFNKNYWHGEMMPLLKKFYFDEYAPRLFFKNHGIIPDNQIDPLFPYLFDFKRKNQELFYTNEEKEKLLSKSIEFDEDFFI